MEESSKGKYSYIWGCPNLFTTKDRTHKRKPLRQKKQFYPSSHFDRNTTESTESNTGLQLIARKLDHHAGKTSFQKPAALQGSMKAPTSRVGFTTWS